MIVFSISGHHNLLGTHRATLEFIRGGELSRNGDCIIGTCAGFSIDDIRRELSGAGGLTVEIEVNGEIDRFECQFNDSFSDSEELVIRKTDFISGRTLGIRATKAACDLRRDIIEQLKDEKTRGTVRIWRR
jgi:uncharacterized protein